MKKIITIIMALCLALLPAVVAEENNPNMLEGTILDITQEGILINDINLGEVLLMTDENTTWDGIYATEKPEIGQYIIVENSGRMTMSLPAQTYALKIACHRLQGIVMDIHDGSFMLAGDPVFGEVQVNTDHQLYLNVPVTVYYDGAMTASLPGQAAALHLVWPSLTGTVSEIDAEGFMLKCDDGAEYKVVLSTITLMTDPNAETQSEDGIATPNVAPIELAEGMQLTGIYNGNTTRTTPPRLIALEVILN